MGVHDLAAAALRRLDPERAHALAFAGLRAGLGPGDAGPDDPLLSTDLAGLRLPNPIGLAAGFDKNAVAPSALLHCGFGFVEVGTVTPCPQAGNPRPRLFRLEADRAIINRLGFNNDGHDRVARRLLKRPTGVIGVNVGANKDSDDRIADYVHGVRRFAPLVDYLTINVSSPNTPGLRDLQSADALAELLGRCMAARPGARLFLKVAPDLGDGEIADIAATVIASGIAGLIVSNTTLVRSDSLRSARAGEAGGLSGAPLMTRSTEVLAAFRAALPATLPLIGVGGIFTSDDVLAKLRAGASAVQLYTAMIYEGPGLVARIKRELSARLRAEGFASVGEAVRAR